jgi:hypothetical protein
MQGATNVCSLYKYIVQGNLNTTTTTARLTNACAPPSSKMILPPAETAAESVLGTCYF